jgi:DNA-binding beta-propeller fold protein YncE
MNKLKQIERIDPGAGIPGGEVAIECANHSRNRAPTLTVRFQDLPAHVVAATPSRALVLVPDLDVGAQVDVSVADDENTTAKPAQFVVAKKLADGIHPVTSPTFDPADGSLFVTRSGARGENLPVSIFRIGSETKLEEFSADITNPTSIAFDRSGRMFVTSRLDGIVYRMTPLKEVVVFASDLGIATGLAFNRDGEMFVGDRTGVIYRVNGIGEAKPWAQMEPSVSAYHLAFGPDNALYVTGPTVSSFDAITRFDEDGESTVFYRGLGRPQGLAFDRDGNLYVAASFRGRRGIVRISPDAAQTEIVVAGMNLVGLAFSPKGEMVVATNDAVYSLPLGIYGTLVE